VHLKLLYIIFVHYYSRNGLGCKGIKECTLEKKVYDNSRRSEMKKYAILMALAKQNNIKTEETINIVKKEKKKLIIHMTDM